MKLSELWDLADKELTQLKCDLGDPQKKTACALGAIIYYASDRRTTGEGHGIPNMRLIDQYGKFQQKFGDVVDLNNKCDWTFKMFADAARKIGL